MSVRTTTRTIPAPTATIVPATDLGNVEVAKAGNLYLLTDQRGDIRIDGRGLGLYDLDTRILCTSILRLNGSPLTLLRGPHQSDGADIIQLTNPELRRNPDDKRAVESSLARRDLSLTRARHIDGDLRELVTVVNYSATVEHLEIQLGIGVDMADIFEVRGYPRAARGTLLPIVLDGDRATFAYDGVDGLRRTTTIVAGGATLEPVDDGETWPAATVLASWRLSLQPGARQTVGWHVSASVGDDGTPARAPAVARGGGKAASPATACGPPREPTARSTPHGSSPTTSCSTGRWSARWPTWPRSATTARVRASRTWRPGSPGSRRCSGATA